MVPLPVNTVCPLTLPSTIIASTCCGAINATVANSTRTDHRNFDIFIVSSLHSFGLWRRLHPTDKAGSSPNLIIPRFSVMEDGRYDQARHLFADRSAGLVEGLKCVSPFVP